MFNGYTLELIEDLNLRWRGAQARLRAVGADALLVTTNVNTLYLSGRVFMGHIYLPVEGAPLFFVRRPAGLQGERVVAFNKPEQIPEMLRAAGLPQPQKLLMEGDELAFSAWQRLAEVFGAEAVGNGSALLRQSRACKTAYEVRLMRKTGQRHAEVIARYASVYEPGMTDQAWSIELFHLMLQAGCLGIFRIAGGSMESFMGTILAGDNGAAVSPYDFALGGAGLHPSLPVGQSGVVLKSGMAVMVDIAANFYGYLTDCSRTFAIERLSPEACDAHQLSIAIQKAIAAAGKPGVACEALYQMALDMAATAGMADYFMGGVQKAKFIGHGTGLVINEQPVIGARSKDVLAEGMCIALEPKFVIPGAGAVGVEDTFLVTAGGMQNLTACDTDITVL